LLEEVRAGELKTDQITPKIRTLEKLRIHFMLWWVEIRVFIIFLPLCMLLFNYSQALQRRPL